MRTSFRSLIACLIAVLAPRATAGVLVVDSSGSGPFTDLPAAVSAAVDGDVLLLKSGVYAGTTISNKALDLVADSGASVVIQGQLLVVSLAATRAVSVTGVTLRASTHLGSALSLLNSAGSVRIQGCNVQGFDQSDCVLPSLPGGPALSIVGCDDVSVTRCTIEGGRSGDAVPYTDIGAGAAGISVSGSRLALYENEITGGRGGSEGGACGGGCGYGYAGDGGDGVTASNCATLFASGCGITGGDAGASILDSGCLGTGVRLASTTLTTLDSSVARGDLTQCAVPLNCPCFAAVCPLGAPWQVVTGPARRLVATRVAREATLVRIDVFGVPGDQVELSFASRGVFQPMPAGTGVGLLRREKPGLVAQLGTIGPSGQLTTSWNPQDLGPGVLGTRIFVQADFIEPSGRVLRGPPATIVLLDSSL